MKKKLKLIFMLMNLIIGSSLLLAVENASPENTSQHDSKNIPAPLLKIISIEIENIPTETAMSKQGVSCPYHKCGRGFEM